MSKRLIDVLPKIPQYEDIPYARDFVCPNCDKSGFVDYHFGEKHDRPRLVAWTETNIGYMAIFECPYCGQKYRFHPTIGTWVAPIDEFDDYLYYYASMCSNYEELKEKVGEDF